MPLQDNKKLVTKFIKNAEIKSHLFPEKIKLAKFAIQCS